MEPIAADAQVMLHKECSPVAIEASAKQMRELVMNLVSNGIKYNHPGGNVWVEAWQEKGSLYIRVKDDGCGIDRQEQGRIFERFYRVDKGRSKKIGGTGLGLSIVKHIVEYYSGSIQLESEPGKGSCFTVELPLRKRIPQNERRSASPQPVPNGAFYCAGRAETGRRKPCLPIKWADKLTSRRFCSKLAS